MIKLLAPGLHILLGDSAGGTLAALVAHDLRPSRLRPAAQVLLYPATDLQAKHASLDDAVPILSAEQIKWLRRQVASVSGGTVPKLSP